VRMKSLFSSICIMAVVLTAGCVQNSSKQEIELKHYPLDDMKKIITRSNIQIDKEISDDGKGSLRTSSVNFKVIRLIETGNLDVEDARLIYRAKIRTREFEGEVFLGMECHFPDKGDLFVRDSLTVLSGTTYWTSGEVVFNLKKGENPDNVKLHLIMNGRGTAWIDDLRLLKAPPR
jgi:hypothetical protein